MAIVDAGQGAEADSSLKTRDRQSRVCVAIVSPTVASTDLISPGTEVLCAVLSWKSYGVSRVTHASFDFEAISVVSSFDLLSNVREIAGEVTTSGCPSLREEGGEARRRWKVFLPGIELHTDSISRATRWTGRRTQSTSGRRRTAPRRLPWC